MAGKMNCERAVSSTTFTQMPRSRAARATASLIAGSSVAAMTSAAPSSCCGLEGAGDVRQATAVTECGDIGIETRGDHGEARMRAQQELCFTGGDYATRR